jgi:hypothetical protein
MEGGDGSKIHQPETNPAPQGSQNEWKTQAKGGDGSEVHKPNPSGRRKAAGTNGKPKQREVMVPRYMNERARPVF